MNLLKAWMFTIYTTVLSALKILGGIFGLYADGVTGRNIDLFEENESEPKIAYDPVRDILYDMVNGIEKTIRFLDHDGHVVISDTTGEPLKLCNMWNAGAEAVKKMSLTHPHFVLTEAISLIVGMGPTSSKAIATRDVQVMCASQFGLGLGKFLSLHKIRVTVDVRKLNEIEMEGIRRKFSDESE